MDNLEILKLLQTSSATIRGVILNDTIYIERLMDEYISRYFCEDKVKKKELMLWVICERLNFDSKKQLFEYILTNHNKAFQKKYDKEIKSLKAIMETRNILAHYMLDTSDSGIEVFHKGECVRFLKFKNVNENVDFNQERVDKLKDKISKVVHMLRTIKSIGRPHIKIWSTRILIVNSLLSVQITAFLHL